ncbi:MAG: ABC transporter permease [Acidobacteria bacterium]|nr:ABC transporter permease [Acidobacteriota bacterium]
MNTPRYLLRSLAWHGKAHLAAGLGAAVATAVLTGALLTGSSVRRSLRTLVEQRLGATEYVVSGRGFFRAALAREFSPEWRAAPLVVLEGSIAHEPSGRRANVEIYAVDAGFYAFHRADAVPPGVGRALLSPALAAELDAKGGDAVLLRFEEPTAIPREFLYGRKEDTARTLRFTLGEAVSPAAMADFALRPRQGDVRAVFIPLDRLQRDLKLTGRANTLLLSGSGSAAALAARLRQRFKLEDAGLRLRSRPGTGEIVFESESSILDDRTAEAALAAGKRLGILARPSLVYLANTIAANGRRAPYSLVAAVDERTLAEINSDRAPAPTKGAPVLLNEWAAAELGVKPGDRVTMDYFLWSANGELHSGKADFEASGVVPIRGLAADRDLAPEYPGITDKTSLSKWDPPFPIDLKRISPRDEQYWQLFRTTPKAWVLLETGRRLWGSRFGSYTSIRFTHGHPQLEPLLSDAVDPLSGPMTLISVRRQSLDAAQGSTDFGEYFLYFSFFVIAAALLLMALFFRLGIEQRHDEAALLRAVGFTTAEMKRLLAAEGLVVATLGALSGAVLAPLYAWLIIHGLRTWWSGATGTRLLSLSADPALLVAGALTGLAAASVGIWQALAHWDAWSPRELAGTASGRTPARWLWSTAWATLLLGLAMPALGLFHLVPAQGAFFGGGLLLLVSFLLRASLWLRRHFVGLEAIPGNRALARLALRNASWRPGRTLVSLALIAPAAFLLSSLEAFRHDGGGETGGFALYAESQSPIILDPSTKAGAEALNLQGLPPLRWVRFRLRPGDDVSCLNLYQPRNPRLLGVPEQFLRESRFRFAGSTGQSAETRKNPWLLLESQQNGGVIPAIVDQNSLVYVLHKRLGDEIELPREGADPVRLKLVAALEGSLFQSEILIAEKNFTRLFPQIAGRRVFLIEGPAGAAGALEEALSPYGFDAQDAAERLRGYFRVEDTYLSTFQALGSFGLLLGTVGLAAVLLRNTLERRRELALLRAAGFNRDALGRLIVLETAAVLAAGLLGGTVCAAIAVAPALASRGALLPVLKLAALAAFIFIFGMAVSWLAARVESRAPLAQALRGE